LTPVTKDVFVRIFGYALKTFKNLSFQATMNFVDFCVLASPGDRFGASERNKDALHASTASTLILGASRTISMAAVLACLFPNRFLKKKRREEGRREREKKKKEEKGEREKRRQQTSPHHGPNVARAKRALLFG
jgi:hypothetical protein